MNSKESMTRYTMIKMSKVKDREYKGSKWETSLHTREPPIRLSAEVSAETLQTRMEWHDIFKVLKEKKKTKQNNFQPRILYMQSFHPKLKEGKQSFLGSQLSDYRQNTPHHN